MGARGAARLLGVGARCRPWSPRKEDGPLVDVAGRAGATWCTRCARRPVAATWRSRCTRPAPVEALLGAHATDRWSAPGRAAGRSRARGSMKRMSWRGRTGGLGSTEAEAQPPLPGEAAPARRLAPVGVLRVARPRRRAGAHRAHRRGHGGRRRSTPRLRGHAVRHQRALPPHQLAHRLGAPLDAAPRPLGHLPAHRRLLHAVRDPGHRRHAWPTIITAVVWGGALLGHPAQARLDRRAQVAGGRGLRGCSAGWPWSRCPR